jgi:hypothetical protein
MEINQRKCQYAACKCVVASEDLFCSPYCEEHAQDGAPTCDCDHQDCRTSIADPVTGFAAA